jgi:hypothetical protein
MPQPVNVLSKHFRPPDPPPDYGRLAYAAWTAARTRYTGWDELTAAQQARWQRVGATLRAAVLREVWP